MSNAGTKEQRGGDGNSSGQGEDAVFPAELAGWNWGAFLLHWIWARSNNVPLSWRILIPPYGFVVIYRLGVNGNEYAWRNRYWKSIDQFRVVQRKWARAGVAWLALSVLLPPLFFFGVLQALKGSEVAQLAMAAASQNPEVQRSLGRPLEMGWLVTGKTNLGSRPSGHAELSIPISGPNGSATLYVIAKKRLGLWDLKDLVVEFDDTGERFDILRSVPPNERAPQ